jgi:hypothetical protein
MKVEEELGRNQWEDTKTTSCLIYKGPPSSILIGSYCPIKPSLKRDQIAPIVEFRPLSLTHFISLHTDQSLSWLYWRLFIKFQIGHSDHSFHCSFQPTYSFLFTYKLPHSFPSHHSYFLISLSVHHHTPLFLVFTSILRHPSQLTQTCDNLILWFIHIFFSRPLVYDHLTFRYSVD